MKKERYLSRDIILILVASFFYMACPMAVTPLLVGAAGSFGSSGFVLGIIGGMMNFCSLVCRPFAGNFSDYTSKYRMSLTGAVIMTVACLGYVFAKNTLVFVVARVVHGIGFSMCSVCLSSWMASLLPANKIGSGMGLYGTMNALSMAFAPSIGIKLYDHFGYSVAFIAAAVAAALTAVIILFIKDRGLGFDISQLSWKEIKVVDSKVLPLALIVTLFTIPYCANQSFIVSYVKANEISLDVSLFYPIYAGVLIMLRLGLKSLFDKVAFKYFLFAGSISATAALFFLWRVNSYFSLILAAIFMAGGYGIMCSVCQSTAIIIAEKGHSGLANSTYYVGLDSGLALGPIVGGVLYDNFDLQYFYPSLMLAVLLGLLSYALLFPKKRSPATDNRTRAT